MNSLGADSTHDWFEMDMTSSVADMGADSGSMVGMSVDSWL